VNDLTSRWCTNERVACDLSTPTYRRAFEHHGWGDTARRASELSRAQRWTELAALVDDEMLHTVASIGTFDDIARVLNERYAGRVDRIEFSIPVNGSDDAERLRRILGQIERSPRVVRPA
jgi:hypothetical protein